MTSDEELISLASKYCDESLSGDEATRLNELLRDEQLRRVFLEVSNLHYALKTGVLSLGDEALANMFSAVHEAIIPDRVDMTAAPAPTASADGRRRLLAWPAAGEGRRWQPRTVIKRVMLVGATAAAVIVAFMTVAPHSQDAGVRPKDPGAQLGAAGRHAPIDSRELETQADSKGFVARVLAATKDVTWQRDGAPRDFLMRFAENSRIKLATGALKLEFSGGAEIVLHAPADFQIVSASEARLHMGTLSGRSDDGSFSLFTPAAKVIDVGTQFGVSVDADRSTDVSVFDGEVHVRPMRLKASDRSMLRLTQGMSARVDSHGIVQSESRLDASRFPQLPSHRSPSTLSASEVSLVDVIGGSGVNEHRLAGSIDPATGYWGQPPWEAAKGVEVRPGRGQFISAPWNPLVDGVFVPAAADEELQIDSDGHTVRLGATTGATWGPIWARRRLDDALDPLGSVREEDVQGFWGVGTIAAMRERLMWSRDGLVGMHSNVGITIDLQAIRKQYGRPVKRLRGMVTHLERYHESNPLYPEVRADFRVYAEGQLRYERRGFRRRDGDAQFGVSFDDADRFLTLVSTDSDGSNTFDHVILIDPILELDQQ